MSRTARDDSARPSIIYRLEGRVLLEADERPLAAATINLSSGSMVRSDSAGVYLVQFLAREMDRVEVEVVKEGQLPERRAIRFSCYELVAPPGGEAPMCAKKLDFYMRPDSHPGTEANSCTLTGRVMDESTRSPRRGVFVQIAGADRPATVMTDSSGRYTIHQVRPGVHIVATRAIGSVAEVRLLPLQCANARSIVELDFRLRPDQAH